MESKVFYDPVEFREGLGSLRPDEMTKEERIEALIAGKPIDRVPFIPITQGFFAVQTSLSLADYYSDPFKAFQAMVRTGQMFDLDGYPGNWWGFADNGPWEFGGEIKLPTGQYEQGPIVTRRAGATEEEAWNLQVPEVKTAGMNPFLMEFSKLQQKYGHRMFVFASTPWAMVRNIVGAENFARWTIKNPKLMHHLIQLAFEYRIRQAQYWVDTFGPDRLLFWDGVGGAELISLKMWEEFCLQYLIELHAKARSLGIPHSWLHFCGDHRLNLHLLPKPDYGDPGMCSISHFVDIDDAIKHLGEKCIIMGNIQAELLVTSTPEEIYELCRIAIEKGKKAPRGFVLMTGCELPPCANPYSVYMMRKAVSDFGFYD